MSEIVVLHPDELQAQIKLTLQEVLREELLKIQDTQTDDSYVTRKELARRFKKSESTIDRWRKCGYLKGHNVGRSVLFISEEVEQALREIPALKKYAK